MSSNHVSHPLETGCPPEWATEWGDDRRGVFVGFTVGEVTHRLRWIRPGRFLMGSPATDEERYDWEWPPHEVTVSRGFWLGETPCTQKLWQAVTGENPSQFKGPTRPVERVSWKDCQAFLEELNERPEGPGFRLPTEAEWEYACRAGTQGARYDDEKELADLAWFDRNSGGETHPVGGKLPNPWGLRDMLGNVYEWCSDGFEDAYARDAQLDPTGATDGSNRVNRGGAWGSVARSVRSAYRNHLARSHRSRDLGFRLARAQE